MSTREADIADRVSSSITAASPEALVEEISDLTERNDHTEALVVLAKALNERKTLKALEAIAVIGDFLRYVPGDLVKVKNGIRSSLIDEAKRKFGPDIGQQIYMSF